MYARYVLIVLNSKDPVCFDAANFRHSRITINGGCDAHHFPRDHSKSCCYFTDKIAKTYAKRVRDGERIVFISDIRTGDPQHQSDCDVEYYVLSDHAKQRKWIEIIKPLRSMLKFRCPYPDRFGGKSLSKFRYLDGELYFQPYLGPTSSETRLVVEGGDSIKAMAMREYDVYEYEERLFWWNTVVRQCVVRNPYYCPEMGFIHSFDCWLEGVILERYCIKMFKFKKNRQRVLRWFVPLMVHHITKKLSPSGNTTLLTQYKSKDNLGRMIDHTKQCRVSPSELEAASLKHLRFNNTK